MLTDELLKTFSTLLSDIPAEDMIELFSKASERQLQQGEIYINRGDTSRMLAFIQSGIIRTYTEKENGDEATLLLRWENQFTGSHDTIIMNQPSRFVYQALEPTVVLELDYGTVEQILTDNARYEPLRNFVLMTMLGGALDMLEDFVLLTPEQRYRKLVSEKFDIVNRVADKHIASMLGITPVSLSRIRKRMFNKH